MILQVVTFNVRGLNDSRKIDILKNYLQKPNGGADIILLQEHKLRGEKAANLGPKLLLKRKHWTLDAEAGYNVDGSEGAGRGGICTLLKENLAPLVSNHGTILHNRAFWFRLSGLPGGDVGVLNLYAPNNPRERIAIWQELSTRLPADCRWIVSEDFNMRQNQHDKSSLCGKSMSQRERIVWDAFKSSLNLSDNFNPAGKLRFSWDNKRRDECRILARLDRHYVSTSPAPISTYPHATTT